MATGITIRVTRYDGGNAGRIALQHQPLDESDLRTLTGASVAGVIRALVDGVNQGAELGDIDGAVRQLYRAAGIEIEFKRAEVDELPPAEAEQDLITTEVVEEPAEEPEEADGDEG